MSSSSLLSPSTSLFTSVPSLQETICISDFFIPLHFTWISRTFIHFHMSLSCYLNNYLYSFFFAYLQCIFCAPYLCRPFFSPLSIASLQTKTDACPSIKKRIKACYITYIGLPTSEILVPQYVSSECLISDLITEPPITSNFIVHLVANKIEIDHISFFLIFPSSSNFFEYFALVFEISLNILHLSLKFL